MKVREVVGAIEKDGWALVATRGSHRQYKHGTKPGRVTIAGKPSDDVAGHAGQHLQAGRPQPVRGAVMRYAVVIERAGDNYSANVPDLPGCIATAHTAEAVERAIREAIRFHIDGLWEDGVAVPEATSRAEYVEA